MTALFRCRAARSEIAELFGCEVARDLRWRAAHWPGESALVVRLADEQPAVELMHWGMPASDGRRRPLCWAERNIFARLAFHERSKPPGRCLIPLDSFALPDGQPGKRTRSWFGLWDAPIFAWGGLWRTVDGIGLCFFGATTPANALVARVGKSMPVIVAPENHDLWLNGPVTEVMRLWRLPYCADAMWLEQTDELWASGRFPEGEEEGSATSS